MTANQISEIDEPEILTKITPFGVQGKIIGTCFIGRLG
jgi:hypothetical protein